MTSPAADDLTGHVFSERFEVLELLASGGASHVYRARHLNLDRDVALKVYAGHAGHDAAARERFEHEARAASRLDHPNNVRIIDFGRSDDGHLFIAMERLEGQTLRQAIRSGPLSPARAGRVIAQLAKALDEAHAAGLVHRDVKPENIFLCDIHGETDFVKLIDYGLAAAIGQADAEKSLAEKGYVCGTPGYIAPEHALGLTTDARADLYALGVVLHELLTGERPFVGSSDLDTLMLQLHAPVPKIPAVDGPEGEGLAWLAGALMDRNPTRRPAWAGAVVGYLAGDLDRDAVLSSRRSRRRADAKESEPSAAAAAPVSDHDDDVATPPQGTAVSADDLATPDAIAVADVAAASKSAKKKKKREGPKKRKALLALGLIAALGATTAGTWAWVQQSSASFVERSPDAAALAMAAMEAVDEPEAPAEATAVAAADPEVAEAAAGEGAADVSAEAPDAGAGMEPDAAAASADVLDAAAAALDAAAAIDTGPDIEVDTGPPDPGSAGTGLGRELSRFKVPDPPPPPPPEPPPAPVAATPAPAPAPTPAPAPAPTGVTTKAKVGADGVQVPTTAIPPPPPAPKAAPKPAAKPKPKPAPRAAKPGAKAPTGAPTPKRFVKPKKPSGDFDSF